jgi:hypothetical protein
MEYNMPKIFTENKVHLSVLSLQQALQNVTTILPNLFERIFKMILNDIESINISLLKYV